MDLLKGVVMENASRWGRDDLEWNEMIDAATAFLQEQARLQRTTSYTELNAVLSNRTDSRTFDFNLESERAALGSLLGEIALANLSEVGAMLSAIVIYLNENDAGAGFYRYAIQLGLLDPNPSSSAKFEFWISQVTTVYRHFSGSGQ